MAEPRAPAHSRRAAKRVSPGLGVRVLINNAGIAIYDDMSNATLSSNTDMNRGFDVPKGFTRVGGAGYLRGARAGRGGHLPRSRVSADGRRLARRGREGAQARTPRRARTQDSRAGIGPRRKYYRALLLPEPGPCEPCPSKCANRGGGAATSGVRWGGPHLEKETSWPVSPSKTASNARTIDSPS